MKIEGNEYLTVKQAANRAGKAPITVYKAVEAGLAHKRILGRILLRPEDVDARWPQDDSEGDDAE